MIQSILWTAWDVVLFVPRKVIALPGEVCAYVNTHPNGNQIRETVSEHQLAMRTAGDVTELFLQLKGTDKVAVTYAEDGSPVDEDKDPLRPRFVSSDVGERCAYITGAEHGVQMVQAQVATLTRLEVRANAREQMAAAAAPKLVDVLADGTTVHGHIL